MLFGQYLIKIGGLSPEGLLDALDAQQRQVEQSGRIALRHGYLNASRLLRLLDDQVTNRTRVGELASAVVLAAQVQNSAVRTEEQK